MAVETNGRRALVVGSGVAGVTAAYALREKGWDATVLEQQHDVRKLYVGSGIHLWNNTMRALNILGLDDRVMNVSGQGAVVEKMKFITPKGKVLATVKCGDMGRRMGGYHCVGINRAELLPALAEALPDGVIRTDSKVVDYDQDPDGVNVKLADGSTERADVLIGSDGVRSIIRKKISGRRDEAPIYAGYTIWQGICEVDPSVAPLGDFPIVYGPGLRFAYYRTHERRLYWFAVANAPEGQTEPTEERIPMLKQRFAGWPYPIQEILDATDPPVTHRRDLYDLEPLEKWTEGRVALSGDAAHAMTFDIGQGAGQGIEDAVVLARNLSEASDIPAALKTYEQQRKERAEYMQRLSRRVGRAGRWKNPAAVTARNLVTRAILGNPIAVKQFEKDLAYDF